MKNYSNVFQGGFTAKFEIQEDFTKKYKQIPRVAEKETQTSLNVWTRNNLDATGFDGESTFHAKPEIHRLESEIN